MITPHTETIKYADYILNHYDKNSEKDKIVLARDLELKGLNVTDDVFFVCWNVVNKAPYDNRPTQASFINLHSAIAYAAVMKKDPHVRDLKVAQSVRITLETKD